MRLKIRRRLGRSL